MSRPLMLALALALTVLLEVAIQFSRFNDRRRDRNTPDWASIPDDQASPLPDVSPRPQPSTVGAPTSVSSGMATQGRASVRDASTFDDVL